MYRRGALILCLAAAVLCPVGEGALGLEAGAAKVELTPPEDVPLDGLLSRRGRPIAGVHDPVFVRALYLEEDGVPIFFVSADLFAITDALRDRILELTPPAVPEEHVILTATHTLRGPGGLDRTWLGRQRAGRFMPGWLETIAQAASEAMRLAYESRVRGAIGYATGQAPNLLASTSDPPAAVDDRIAVIRVDDSDGNAVAVLTHLAAQDPLPGDSTSNQLSAGYAGAFVNAFEAISSDGVVTFFLNGAAATQTWAREEGVPAGTWTDLNRVAEALALRAKALANEIECRELDIAIRNERVPAPASSAGSFLAETVLLQVLEIERLAIAFVPGVPSAPVAQQLRDDATRLGYRRHITVAPANGYAGAILDEDSFAGRGAHVDFAFAGPEGTNRLVSRIATMYPRADGAGALTDPPAAGTIARNDGVLEIAETGSPTDRGAARGGAYRESDRSAWDGFSSDWVLSQASVWNGSHWRLVQRDAIAARIARPFAADAARPLLAVLPESAQQRLYGMAEAASVSSAELWLQQIALPSSALKVPSEPDRAFVATDGASGPVLLRSVSWPTPVAAVVSRSRPTDGANHVAVGLPWQIGAMAAVNRHGVAVLVLPDRAPDTMRVPADVLIGAVIEQASNFDEAIAWLSEPRPGVAGRVLVAGDGEVATVLVGADPLRLPMESDRVYFDSVPRLIPDATAFEHRLAGLDKPTADDLMRVVLRELQGDSDSMHALAPTTRAVFVVSPAEGTLHVLALDAADQRGFVTYTADEVGHE